jgi:hypothetical protein
MTTRRVTFASWVMCVLSTLAALVLLVMGIGESTPGDGFVIGAWGGLAFAFAALAFGTVGALVSNRLPGNRVGWVFCLIGVALAVGNLAYQYADQALFGEATALPGGEFAAWFQNLTLPPCFGLIAVALMLFPDGRLPSPRWWPAVFIALLGSTGEIVGYAMRPGPFDDPFASLSNPFGVDGGFAFFDTISSLGWPLMGLSCVLAAAAMRTRLKRARGLERQQLKWVTFAGAIAGLMIAVDIASFFWFPVTELNALRVVALGIAFSVIPAAAGVAILRYRLFDIDVVINRTIVYGALTATLAAVYLGSILLLQLVLETFTAGSGLAVAASTLATAALVRPARARIQQIVDRRFYRRKYDAAQTLEVFGARLRDEVDLETLQSDLRSVAAETMQPAHVSLWLRAQEKQQIVTISGRSTRRQESS